MRLLCATLLLLTACNNVVSCQDGTVDVGDLCLPDPLSPNVNVAIEVRELCGPGCSGVPTCTAVFRDGLVVLDITQEVCTTSQTASCIDLGCQQRVMQCSLPGLTAGTYTLQVPGGPNRLLRVASGGQSSCRFALADGGVQ
jgi:hypothetical protein